MSKCRISETSGLSLYCLRRAATGSLISLQYISTDSLPVKQCVQCVLRLDAGVDMLANGNDLDKRRPLAVLETEPTPGRDQRGKDRTLFLTATYSEPSLRSSGAR